MSHRARLREKMFHLIRRWEQSGLTQSEYCREHRFERSRFHYWLKIYREVPQEDRATFLPLVIDDRDVDSTDDRIVLSARGGMTVSFTLLDSSIPLIRQLLQG
jgi:hypothetical protein